jgi:PRC-barrel domain
MVNLTYAARMRYLDADDVDDAVVDYDGLDVYGRDGQKLGNVDGFIIDADARRVNYVVMDSGGWFTSKRLLLPVGHATLAGDRRSLQVDLSRDALSRFPEYDEDRFSEFTDDELRAFERNTVVACCPDEPLEDVSVTTWGYDSRRHYAQPDWWRNANYAPERLRGLRDRMARSTDPASPVAASPSQDVHNRERVMALENPAGDVSPHFEGRAQPGDILGIETGGERTAIGETGEDEDTRRRDAERDARDQPPPKGGRR